MASEETLRASIEAIRAAAKRSGAVGIDGPLLELKRMTESAHRQAKKYDELGDRATARLWLAHALDLEARAIKRCGKLTARAALRDAREGTKR